MRLAKMLMLLAAPLALHAQATQVTIDPGMTREQVVQKLGQPLSSRNYGSFTYLLYRNGCEATCGMNDLVILDSNKVVDAIFRAPARRYTGNSSSPKMIKAEEAKRPGDKPATKAAEKPPAKPSPKKPHS